MPVTPPAPLLEEIVQKTISGESYRIGEPGSKKCHRCRTDLTENNAPPSVLKRGRGACYSCASEQGKEFRVRNPKSAILIRARNNARVRNLIFEITEADIPDIPEFCPVLPWVRLIYQVGEGRTPCSPSLDRIDSKFGYVKGNIRIISDRANSLKSDATDEELIALGTDAASRQE